MDMLSLQKIEQRLKEGYYEADPDALRTMQQLVSEIRRLRELAESEVPDEVV
jgi:Spy/CpxP family protein refolding chaperone